jgi:hypothetical protein
MSDSLLELLRGEGCDAPRIVGPIDALAGIAGCTKAITGSRHHALSRIFPMSKQQMPALVRLTRSNKKSCAADYALDTETRFRELPRQLGR